MFVLRRVGMEFALVVLALAVPTAWSQPFCSAKTVKGSYSFQADGSILEGGLTGPFMRLGWFKTDGAGNVTASTLAVYGGFNFGIENYTGTYSVTADCVIVFDLPIPAPIYANAVFKGRVANDGEDIMFMLMSTENPQAEAKTTVLGHGRRQKLDRCSHSDLRGAYRVELNGWVNLPPVGGGTPVRLLGRVVADGRGGLSSSFIETVGANLPFEEDANGSYTVNPDCTFAMSIPLANLPLPMAVIRGSLIGLGREAFVVLNPQGFPVDLGPPFGIVEINGVVATGSMIHQSVSNADR